MAHEVNYMVISKYWKEALTECKKKVMEKSKMSTGIILQKQHLQDYKALHQTSQESLQNHQRQRGLLWNQKYALSISKEGTKQEI